MPASLDDVLKDAVDEAKVEQRYRSLRTTARLEGPYVEQGGKQLLSFACNDYLGLLDHKHAASSDQGAGASRLITGNHAGYETLEALLAEYKKTQTALVFGSGYLANIGVISSVVGKGDVIFADKFSHACMLDGAKLSGATLKRFKHNDIAHLEQLLETYREDYRHCLIMSESVFSMDGDIAPLDQLAKIKTKHDAWLLIDDAHGLGIQHKDVDIWVGTLSKTLASYGGYVCGSEVLKEHLINHARCFIFTTGLPEAAANKAIASLEYVIQRPELHEAPHRQAFYFAELMQQRPPDSHIVPYIVGNSDKAVQLSQHLREQGILAHAIRPPTVPTGTARLRLSFQANHTKEHVKQLVETLKRCEAETS